MNRAKRRAETRRQQREARGQFHPRELARTVVHSMMNREELGGVNRKKPGVEQSPFAKNWRNIAERISAGG